MQSCVLLFKINFKLYELYPEYLYRIMNCLMYKCCHHSYHDFVCEINNARVDYMHFL